MRKVLGLATKGLLLVLFFTLIEFHLAYAQQKKHVLILNSYHQGYKWTDDETRGILGGLEWMRASVNVYVEYMGTKWASGVHYFERLRDTLKYKYHDIHFDVLIATDNDAFNFLRHYRDDVFGRGPSVFCGVNYVKKEDPRGYELFTDLDETVDFEAGLDLILRLHPGTKRIVLITDTTISGREIHEEFMTIVPRYEQRVEFEFLEDMEMQDILLRVADLSEDSVIFCTFSRYMFDYNQLNRYGIRLADLPGDSVFVNMPSSFYELNKGLVRAVVAGILALVIVVLVLLANNHRRKQAEEALRQSENKYRTLIDNVNIGVYRTTVAGRFLQVNPALAKMFGFDTCEDLMKTGVPELYQDPEDRRRLVEDFEREGSVQNREVWMRKKDGSPLWASLTGVMHRDEHGGCKWVDGVVEDITERKTAEEALQRLNQTLELGVRERTAELVAANEALRRQEQEFQAIADNSPDIIARLDRNLLFTYVNPKGEDLKGMSASSLVGKSVGALDCPEDVRLPMENACRTVLDTGRRCEYEFDMPSKAGSRHYESRIIPEFVREGSVESVMVITRDITERRRAEAALRESEERLRFLSSRLLTAQEEERKIVARDLHDSIGGSLAALKFGIENALRPEMQTNHPAMIAALESLVPMIQNTIEEARRIYMALRPSILDDLGIVATIKWLCRQFQDIYSMTHVEVHVDLEEEDVPDRLQTVIFRVAQEALTNVAKYSSAEFVSLSFVKANGRLELSIEDNGIGFDIGSVFSQAAHARGLGLTSMRERTELSGGSFSLQSFVGEGTMVCASWSYAPLLHHESTI